MKKLIIGLIALSLFISVASTTEASWFGDFFRSIFGRKEKIEQVVPPASQRGAAYIDDISLKCSTGATVTTYPKLGDSGKDVTIIQTALDCFGFTDGPNDGYYGKETTAAVLAFQTKYGIDGNGTLVGEKTLMALNIKYMGKTSTNPEIVFSRSLSTPPTTYRAPGTTNVRFVDYQLRANIGVDPFIVNYFSVNIRQVNPAGPVAIKNLKLFVDGNQVGQTITNPVVNNFVPMGAPNTFGAFNVSMQPGQTRNFSLYFDINPLATPGTVIDTEEQIGVAYPQLLYPGVPVMAATQQQPLEANDVIITTTSNPISLALTKIVEYENGGFVDPRSFELILTGPTPVSGYSPLYPQVLPGVYTLTENGPAGYNMSWDCDNAVVNGNQVTIPSYAPLGVNCQIHNDDIPPKLTLRKVVIGGPSLASQWILNANGRLSNPTNLSGRTGVTSGDDFKTDTYTLSEVADAGVPAGYTVSWSCTNGVTVNPGNQITLPLAKVTECTATNTYTQPPLPATITLKKTVIGGGPLVSNTQAFNPQIDNSSVTWSVSKVVTPGVPHTFSETPQPNYTSGQWTGTGCVNNALTGSGVVLNIQPGQNIVCDITNTYVPQFGTISLSKIIENNGWFLNASSFQPLIDGIRKAWGDNQVTPGMHTVGEIQYPGYQASAWGGDCAPDGTVNVPAGGAVDCYIYNRQFGRLQLMKTVSGGNADQSYFQASIDGSPVRWGDATYVSPGVVHTVTETTLPDYVATTWSGDCAPDGSVTVPAGVNKVCYITNKYSPQQTTLTLMKTVTPGGPGNLASFTPRINGSNIYNGSTVLWNTPINVTPGQYTVSEIMNITGYTAGRWGGDCAHLQVGAGAGLVTLAAGDNKVCTITNTYVPPRVCEINDNDFYVTPTTTSWTSASPSKLNFKVNWTLGSNCQRAIIDANVGSSNRSKYTSTSRTGSRSFSLSNRVTRSTRWQNYTNYADPKVDLSLDVTFATYEVGTNNLITKTKTIPITSLWGAPGVGYNPGSPSDQCHFDLLNASPRLVSGTAPSVTLSWSTPQSYTEDPGCDVFIEAWTKNPFNIGSHPSVTRIVNPARGDYFFDREGTITLTPTQSTTYHVSSSRMYCVGPHPCGFTTSVKTVDIKKE